MIQPKKYNPKSSAPAVYIPCWLLQIPSKQLSYAAKMLYGRLSQWSNGTGEVYRSIPQLAKEIGCQTRQVDRYLKELKDKKLVGTYHPQAGGSNHYEFYHHPWMDEPINNNLVYKSDPATNVSLPHDKYVVTPTTNMSSINRKEIKTNKKETCTSSKNTPEEVLPSTRKTNKNKPLVTKEVAMYIAIWNELAVQHGLKPVGQDKRQLNAISRSIKTIKQDWEIELNEKTFRTWLIEGIKAKHYRLDKFKHRMDICLRWEAFMEIFKLEEVYTDAN
jgi:hypothetical protein